MIKAYIFDMDGTLVDNCAWHVKAWREFAVRHGREITEQEILDWMGAPSAYYMNRIFDREVPPDECAALTREKESLYRELYAPYLRLPDGLGELLRNARSQDVRLAIATGGSMDNVDFVLDGLGLRDLFDVVVDASQYEHGKPAPDCYLMAAARLGLTPSECLVFEDAVGGIRAAKAAGMRVAAITATMPRDTLAAEHPDILLESFVKFPLVQQSGFVCRQCGACCRIKDGIVRVSDAEIARIAAFVGMSERDFIDNETEIAPDRRGLILKSRPDGSCAWLGADNRCRIHPVKPVKCRTFPYGWTNPDSAEICPGLAERHHAAFERLAKSKFRSRFHLSEEDRAYIADKGMETIRRHCEDFIRERLAPSNPTNDGRQTPMRGHPVFKAQHACACCCRGCLAKWWKVPRGVEIPIERQQGIVDFLMAWIEREIRT